MDNGFDECSQGFGWLRRNCIFGGGEKNFFYNGSDPLFFCKTDRKKDWFWEGRRIEIWSSRNGSWVEISGKWGDFEDQTANRRDKAVLGEGVDGKNEVTRRKIIFCLQEKWRCPISILGKV
jgi:hypothetical protein